MMKSALLLLTFSIFSASADSNITVQSIPEMKYLFRDLNIITKTPTEIKAAELRTHDAIEEMHSEARSLNLRIIPVAFTTFDFKEVKVREAGLEVSGPELKKISPDKLRTRPSGKYLVFRFKGNVQDLTFKEVDTYLKKNNLKLRNEITFQHKKSVLPLENNLSVFIFPLN